jgi:predicted RNase H-like HicB family nuclease
MLPAVTNGPYAVTLERGADGSYLAWVNELPGCAVRGASKEDVLARLPGAIREFLSWTGSDAAETLTVKVVAEVQSTIEADEDTEVLVRDDEAPLGADDWAQVESWLGRSRAELTALLSRLSDDQLAATREGAERTIREELEHVAFVELMYAMWTFELRTQGGLLEFLAWTRRLMLERMRQLAALEAHQVTSADWAGAPRPEPWTPRKAARRLVWHELLHLRAIQRFADSG